MLAAMGDVPTWTGGSLSGVFLKEESYDLSTGHSLIAVLGSASGAVLCAALGKDAGRKMLQGAQRPDFELVHEDSQILFHLFRIHADQGGDLLDGAVEDELLQDL